jgi:hypothetical protein
MVMHRVLNAERTRATVITVSNEIRAIHGFR